MKAVLWKSYGPPEKLVHVGDVEKPVPGERQVLLKVQAASVNISDYYGMTGIGRLFGGGILRPKDPRVGGDVSGVVEAVGPNVMKFKPGDAVFGVCPGAMAEYAAGHEDKLALKPAISSFEEAASVPVAGLTALQCLRDRGKVQPGQDVAVNGASGGVGTFAVQIAHALGARVTGVCSTRNLERASSIGAEHLVDYTREDFTRDGWRYDLICDSAGNRSVSDYRRALKPGGTCLVVGFAGNPLYGLVKFTALGKLGGNRGGQEGQVNGNSQDQRR